MSTTAPALGARVGEGVKWRSKIYKAIVTPINFVAFLLALYLIDNQYRAQRQDQHEANERPWLHRFLYQQRSSPCNLVDNYQGPSSPQSANTTHRHGVGTRNVEDSSRSTKEAGDAWLSHTNQKKLLRREVADAFALRDSVLLALCVLAVLVGWVLWRMVAWLTA
ncbi:hypothetical protein F4803DRAFT_322087 [Xylaria telfairii]|nr:hypothetical protein F4803DRAFT_322087 [Xylaria telfairii]